jgi:hypothetical protein
MDLSIKGGKKGRPRGGAKPVIDSLSKAIAYPELLRSKKVKVKKESVVGSITESVFKRIRPERSKSQHELEDAYKEEFLAGKFKVRYSFIISGPNQQWDKRDGDTVYKIN